MSATDVVVDKGPTVGAIISVAAGIGQIALANVDGELFAFDDECTHEGCPLSDGELEGFVVVCDCHGGEFDVRTGEPLAGPVQDPVVTYPVVVQADESIRVQLSRGLDL